MLLAETRLHNSGMLRRWLVFNIVGGLGILVQLGSLAVLTAFLGLNYLLSTALAVEAAVLHNFVWHERWTWAERAQGGISSSLGRLLRFHLTNGLLSMAGNLLLMRLLAGEFGMNYTAANVIAIFACSVLNFFAGDRFVFYREAMQKNCENIQPHRSTGSPMGGTYDDK
jgi:putative flippase GtrA